MEKNWKKGLAAGVILLLAFVLWTVLIMTVDVQPIGLTGVHMKIYTVTDWLGLVPIAVCACFGVLGLMQWIKRRSLKKVDPDIILLGIYYILVILGYLFFEMVPINRRPVLIEGVLEASYPSSTTLLVLSVMPTLVFQANRRINNEKTRKTVVILSVLFAAFMVIGRTVAGVHWLTDILGAVLLSSGLYLIYRSAVVMTDQRQ